jgi:hypothetical protein
MVAELMISLIFLGAFTVEADLKSPTSSVSGVLYTEGNGNKCAQR